LQGCELRVLDRMHRHGAVELLVVLPDGSRRCCRLSSPTVGICPTASTVWARARGAAVRAG
jgi:hypothetical protein